MNTFYRLATSSAMFLLLSSPAAMHAQYAPRPGLRRACNAWNAPSEFNDAQRRGYQDGIEGARKDYENHRHRTSITAMSIATRMFREDFVTTTGKAFSVATMRASVT